MTIEERLKAIIGDLVFQNAALANQLEQVTAKVAELEMAAPKAPAGDEQPKND